MRTALGIFLAMTLVALSAAAQQFSTAGFFQTDASARAVASMNPVWRFHKGSAPGAQAPGFDDSAWAVVSLPHGVDLLPVEASGCVNYQGEAWYRKHFTPADSLKGKRLTLHFEGIMGKSRIYINGEEALTHYGGYLPAIVDLTDKLRFGSDNVIAVMTDNSNDPSYPPGKPQEALDFTYMGGLYRDCWLIATNDVFVSDPNFEDSADAGLLVDFSSVSADKALGHIATGIRNTGKSRFGGEVVYTFVNPRGEVAATTSRKVAIRPGAHINIKDKVEIERPMLWSPDSPQLYKLLVEVKDSDGKVVDSFYKRIGVRSVEFKGAQGFWLNGKPFGEPLIGANRHQDFAIVGNAVPNSTHWRDAKKLRDAGLRVIRNAHCPQDPAFMDACDELGLFVIVNTPGWQFWSDSPEFAQRVYADIRNMIRRDRNHACVWLWEPILNETWYPADFARRAVEIVAQEFPRGASLAACDEEARGSGHFKVRFSHPSNANPQEKRPEMAPDIAYFTREWGDNVDNWNSHNSPSRVARGWGEVPMLVQARHYGAPQYPYTSLNTLAATSPQHVGGCLWHSFDHQRGYHPDPFYGGIMDSFRQPKYSYELFKAQRPLQSAGRPYATGPMVFIAHEMTPFSPKDVTVYSNCPQVRLSFCKDGATRTMTQTAPDSIHAMKSPEMVFEGMYDFMTDKSLTRAGKGGDVWLLAEGIVDGKVVATHKVAPARRPSRIILTVDNEGVPLTADGADFVTVVAAIADDAGNIKRLSNQTIHFEVEGPATIVGDPLPTINPAPVRWGTAPALIRSSLTPGKIKVRATTLLEGLHTPAAGEIEIESVAPALPMIYTPESSASSRQVTKNPVKTFDRENARRQLLEVERQQEDFGEKS